MNGESDSSPDGGVYGTNYATFKWSNGIWSLIDNCCNYGYDPAEPDGVGTYPGQIVHTSCKPMREA